MTYTETLNLELVDMLGSGYVIDHCIAAFQKRQEEKLYKVYVTDVLKAIADNTFRFAGGYKIERRFYELAYDNKQTVDTEETAEDIIERIKEAVNGCI